MLNQDLNNKDSDVARANVTTGMALPGGAMVEQLAGQRLLLYAEGQEWIAATIEYGDRNYRPVPFLNELEDALHLPEATAEYECVGSLLKKIAKAIECHARLDAPTNLLVASFTLATWVAEFLPTVPVLNVWGTSGTETTLWTLLTHLCRRPLRLVDPSLRQLWQLPAGLAPTIFLRHPGDAALHRLVNVFGDEDMLCGGHLSRICSPTVVFTARPISVPALRLKLPTCGTPFRRITPSEVQALHQVQAQLLKYRLTRHQQVAGSSFDAPDFGPDTRVIARILGACLEGDEIVQEEIMAALKGHDEAAKVVASQSPEAVVLEALLVSIHEKRGSVRVKEITILTNAIFSQRRETMALSCKAVGAIINDLFERRTDRKSKGYEMSLDSTLCAAIHREAYSRGVVSLLEPRPDCRFCDEVVRAAGRSITDASSTSSALSASSAPPVSTPSTSNTPSTPRHNCETAAETNLAAEEIKHEN